MISDRIKSKLDNTIEIACEKEQIPGMTLLIAQHGEPIYEKYVGYRNKAEELPVTKDTIFGLASITKSLVCLAVMQLRDAGKLNVDDKVVSWLPSLKLPNENYNDQIQIHHLMSHTSGLPGLPLVNSARLESIRQDPNGAYLFNKKLPEDTPVVHNVDDLIRGINELDFKLLGPPGTIFNYSNEGYALLQKIIELASGMSFINYVEKNIFAPLQMNDAYFRMEDIPSKAQLTELYAYTEDRQNVFHSPTWWDVGAIYTNGSLKCSTADLMKYMEVYRMDGTVNGVQIVSKASIAEMTTPKISEPNGGSYGYGIGMDVYQNIAHFGHGGSVKGVSSNFQVMKQQGITASVLVNMTDVPTDTILLHCLTTLFDIPEEKQTYEAYPHTAKSLHKFVGSYTSMEGLEATVMLKGNELILQKEDESTLMPISANHFISKAGVHYHFLMEREEAIGICIGKRVLTKI